MPTAIPGHNAIYIVTGALLCWIGWLGLNGAAVLLHLAGNMQATVLTFVNTTLAAFAAAITTLITTGLRFGKPDASLTANGWVAGLVASSASCYLVRPGVAVVIGFAAGLIVVFGIELLEVRCKIDDPGGSIAVHGLAGIWGLVAAGMFAEPRGGFSLAVPASTGGIIGGPGQLLAQLVGIATLFGFILPLAYGLNLALNRFVPLRVAAEGERQGMDLSELGAGEYPDFVTHTDDFMLR